MSGAIARADLRLGVGEVPRRIAEVRRLDPSALHVGIPGRWMPQRSARLLVRHAGFRYPLSVSRDMVGSS